MVSVIRHYYHEDDLLECYCGRGSYSPARYSSCYECFRDRIADLVSCIYCGKKHSVQYSTCFDCRQVSGRDEAAKSLRFDILIRDNFTCNACGTNEALHVDHIKPCCADGEAEPWNLQILCRECNLNKGTDWYFGCRWDTRRIELMHIYFTFGWSLLDERQQKKLCYDASDYTEFDWHVRLREFNGLQPLDPPSWAVAIADSQTTNASKTGENR